MELIDLAKGDKSTVKSMVIGLLCCLATGAKITQ